MDSFREEYVHRTILGLATLGAVELTQHNVSLSAAQSL